MSRRLLHLTLFQRTPFFCRDPVKILRPFYCLSCTEPRFLGPSTVRNEIHAGWNHKAVVLPRSSGHWDSGTLGARFTSDSNNPNKLSLFQKFKAMYRDYWYVLVPVHIVTSLGWFGAFFYLAKSGVDVDALAQSLCLSESVVEKLRKGANTTPGYLAIAYALYKIATPVRYTVTLGGTTISINYLKKWGYIKPIPKKEELRKMYKDKKESLKEKRDLARQNLFDKFKNKKS